MGENPAILGIIKFMNFIPCQSSDIKLRGVTVSQSTPSALRDPLTKALALLRHTHADDTRQMNSRVKIVGR